MTSSKLRLAARTAELVTGFVTWKTIDWAFHYAAYPFAIWRLGLLYGGLLMSGLSLLVCLLLLRFYDLTGRDWLGIEFIKNQRYYDGSSPWRRATAWLIARGDWVAFVALSIQYDPFVTTAYMRRGAYNGMTRRDWFILVMSWFVSNGVWVALCFGGVSVVRLVA